jgi:hypothetical protein
MFTLAPIARAHHHVTDMDADAESDAFLWWQVGVGFGQYGLRFHSALHSVNGAAELREDTIARRVRYASPVVRDGGATGAAIRADNQRRTAILRYASRAAVFPI